MSNFNVNRLAAPALVILAVFILSSCGIMAPRSNPGFANLDSPGMNDTNRTFALSIGPTTLWFAARFLDDDPEVQALLRSLEGVRVRTYEVYGDINRINRNFARMGNKLLGDGWKPVVLVHEEGDLVQMFAKSDSTGIRGLTIVSADDYEVVVVNIMGDIDPVYYRNVMLALDIDDAPDVQIAAVD